jgi:hypothetical protein
MPPDIIPAFVTISTALPPPIQQISAVVVTALATTQFLHAAVETLRPPAVPLVACDPYFSIWSPGDELNKVSTTHWTGKPHPITSLVRIDGKTFRVMGEASQTTAPLQQTQLEVLPTRTIYSFEGAGVKLTLTFLTPALPDDLELLSRPVTYLTYDFQSTDGKSHDVSIQFDANGEITVNEPRQRVVAETVKLSKLTTLSRFLPRRATTSALIGVISTSRRTLRSRPD